jgi:hypothetical protein
MKNHKLIAHRGNFEGNKPYFLNKPEYADIALQYGYDVMLDVWVRGEWTGDSHDDSTFELWVGHDSPRYKVSASFLRREGVWCRAMTLHTYDFMVGLGDIHCFMNDPSALYWVTNRGVLWINWEEHTNREIYPYFPKNTQTVLYHPDGDVGNSHELPVAHRCTNHCKEFLEARTGVPQRELNMNDARDINEIIPDFDQFR